MPGWLTDHFSFRLSGIRALRVTRQSTRKSKTINGRLASLASNPLVTVPVLEKNGLILVQLDGTQWRHHATGSSGVSLRGNCGSLHSFECWLLLVTLRLEKESKSICIVGNFTAPPIVARC